GEGLAVGEILRPAVELCGQLGPPLGQDVRMGRQIVQLLRVLVPPE
ncbi:hypothetical protein LCGC14_1785460, partial [marine sediment metagenome]